MDDFHCVLDYGYDFDFGKEYEIYCLIDDDVWNKYKSQVKKVYSWYCDDNGCENADISDDQLDSLTADCYNAYWDRKDNQ